MAKAKMLELEANKARILELKGEVAGFNGCLRMENVLGIKEFKNFIKYNDKVNTLFPKSI